jgi:Icc-related predicted phosphoesterase
MNEGKIMKPVKIVGITDIHAAYDIAARILEAEKPDVAVIGGDLTNVGSMKEAADAIGRFSKHTRMLVAVAGNMDLPEHDDLMITLGVSINGVGRMHGGVGFFGVSAAPLSRLRTPYEISEERIKAVAQSGFRDLGPAKRKVFVPHAPPFGTKLDIIRTGIHVGSMSVREIIEEHKPDLTICGHIHEARGKDAIDGLPVVNCGHGASGYYCVASMGETVTVELKRHTG